MASLAFIRAGNVLKFVSKYYSNTSFPWLTCPPRSIVVVPESFTIFQVPYPSFRPHSTRNKSSEKLTPTSHGPDRTQRHRNTSETNDSGPKITLIGTDNNVTLTTVSEAQKLSRRRDLKLVKMVDLDTKTQRAVYKLMTGAEFFVEDRKQRLLKAANKGTNIKGEKIVTLSHKISEHDLQSRIKNILKWLARNYEARVIINGVENSLSSTEKIYKLIEDGLNENGRIVQKRQKGNDLKFQVIPPKVEAKQPKEASKTNEENVDL